MFLVNNWKFIAATLAVLALLASVYHFGYGSGSSRVQALWEADKAKLAADAEKDREARQDAADKAEAEAAQRIQDLMVKNNKLAEQVNDEINSNSVYRDCHVPANGVRQYRAIQAGSR